MDNVRSKRQEQRNVVFQTQTCLNLVCIKAELCAEQKELRQLCIYLAAAAFDSPCLVDNLTWNTVQVQLATDAPCCPNLKFHLEGVLEPKEDLGAPGR